MRATAVKTWMELQSRTTGIWTSGPSHPLYGLDPRRSRRRKIIVQTKPLENKRWISKTLLCNLKDCYQWTATWTCQPLANLASSIEHTPCSRANGVETGGLQKDWEVQTIFDLKLGSIALNCQLLTILSTRPLCRCAACMWLNVLSSMSLQLKHRPERVQRGKNTVFTWSGL